MVAPSRFEAHGVRVKIALRATDCLKERGLHPDLGRYFPNERGQVIVLHLLQFNRFLRIGEETDKKDGQADEVPEQIGIRLVHPRTPVTTVS